MAVFSVIPAWSALALGVWAATLSLRAVVAALAEGVIDRRITSSKRSASRRVATLTSLPRSGMPVETLPDPRSNESSSLERSRSRSGVSVERLASSIRASLSKEGSVRALVAVASASSALSALMRCASCLSKDAKTVLIAANSAGDVDDVTLRVPGAGVRRRSPPERSASSMSCAWRVTLPGAVTGVKIVRAVRLRGEAGAVAGIDSWGADILLSLPPVPSDGVWSSRDKVARSIARRSREARSSGEGALVDLKFVRLSVLLWNREAPSSGDGALWRLGHAGSTSTILASRVARSAGGSTLSGLGQGNRSASLIGRRG